MSFYSKDLKEETLKQRVANDFFAKFSYEPLEIFALLKMTKSAVFASFDDIKVCEKLSNLGFCLNLSYL
mgnify:CR=1 FL=1